VADDGPGIAPDHLDAVFEPFVTTREGGTGLGLPLARSVARLHGGELRLESRPGHGTRAILDVPDDAP
jgi:signal transduction histidine kinase